MESYARLRDEISGIRGYVLLNMFGLDCTELNTEMYNRSVYCILLNMFGLDCTELNTEMYNRSVYCV